jgi:phosphoserine phosphatase
LFIATLIAATLSKGEVAEARDRLDDAGCLPVAHVWVEEGEACDVQFGRDLAAARAALEGQGAYDLVVQPVDDRRKKLIVADMDSTMITVECIDELADYAGIKPQIAAITERAMRGELDFGAALDERVALLKGLDESVIDRCLAERVTIMPGAKLLIRTMKGWGARAVLVSGGFTRFAEPVAAEIGFDRAIANRLEIAGGKLAGTVAKPIVDSATKEATLAAEMLELGLSPAQTLAVGDGANDLPMIAVAGLGVAYHAKPIVAAAAGARIDRGDLSALLFAQGIARKDWVAD